MAEALRVSGLFFVKKFTVHDDPSDRPKLVVDNSMLRNWIDRSLAILLGVVGLACWGCHAPQPEFHLNEIEIIEQQAAVSEEITAEQRDQIATVLYAMFGTPDSPDNPWEREGTHVSLLAEQGFNVDLLRMAAGPVGSDEQGNTTGLYRLHCAHCHGITGDGRGPTAAFLNPYPRDYRQGVFKAKSTELAAKPTHADLKRTLIEGFPGTAMPSFKLLKDIELEALVEYVKYLTVRGETEIELIFLTSDEGEVPTDPAVLVDEILKPRVEAWKIAEEKIVHPVTPQSFASESEKLASIERGRKSFYSETGGNCASCHGNLALGDGQTNLYDMWNEPIANPELEADFLAVGALPPRHLRPRNLRQGVYRFGRRPIDIYRRIYVGIAGAQMPAATLKTSDDGPGVSEQDIWDIVNYVQSLPYEPLSLPPELERTGLRERL